MKLLKNHKDGISQKGFELAAFIFWQVWTWQALTWQVLTWLTLTWEALTWQVLTRRALVLKSITRVPCGPQYFPDFLHGSTSR